MADRKAEKRKLDGLMGRVSHLRAEQKRARKRGSEVGTETAQRSLDAAYAQIREHCSTHGLRLPNDIPA
jgi:hypothetical protein